jgi:hypothetical protein
MAIKISNTTVINDSRGLENITNLKTVNGNTILGTGDITAGAGANIFWENDQTLSANYTITTNKNAGTFGPISIANGVTVTIPNGSTWTIV